jgi:hypothetical protein
MLAHALQHIDQVRVRVDVVCVFRPIVTDDFGIVTAHFG